MTPCQKSSLHRLFEITTGDSYLRATVTDFLLAWWAAQKCGAYYRGELPSVPDTVKADMIEVCKLIVGEGQYPNMSLAAYDVLVEAMSDQWRPVLAWWEGLKAEEQAEWRRALTTFTIHEAFIMWFENEFMRVRWEVHSENGGLD